MFLFPLPTTREPFENTILTNLKAIENSFARSTLDEETAIDHVESGAADDETYKRIGSLLQDWLREDLSPIINYHMVRGTA